MRHALLCMLLALAACRTNPETGESEVDWNLVDQELDLTVGDLRELAPSASDPARWEKLADSLELVDAALESWLASGDSALPPLFRALDAALALIEATDETPPFEVKLAKRVLVRMKAYLPPEVAPQTE